MPADSQLTGFPLLFQRSAQLSLSLGDIINMVPGAQRMCWASVWDDWPTQPPRAECTGQGPGPLLSHLSPYWLLCVRFLQPLLFPDTFV